MIPSKISVFSLKFRRNVNNENKIYGISKYVARAKKKRRKKHRKMFAVNRAQAIFTNASKSKYKREADNSVMAS